MANERLENLIKTTKILLPPNFIVNVGDARIQAFLGLVLGDVNVFPPFTGYTIETYPPEYEAILLYGVQVFSLLFMQQMYTLQDFDWNDNGLSIRLDRVSKIDQNYKNVLDFYKNMVINVKKHEIMRVGGKGLGTPRYQSQIGQFLKIALGGSFNWNQP